MRNRGEYFSWKPGDPPPVEVRITHRIVFSEVDALAILWHGRYPALFEEAHTELGHKIGLTYAAFREANIAAPVARIQTDYLRPLHLDEVPTVSARLFWNEGARLDVDYRIFDEEGRLASTGCTSQLFVTLDTREPLWCPPDLWEQCKIRWKQGAFHAGT